MENATKALLIAAAILIAIIIISLGIMVIRQGSETVNNVNLSDTQREAFNSKWQVYNGQQSGTKVKALIKEALNNNRNDNNPKVKLYINTKTTFSGTETNYNCKSIYGDTNGSFKNIQPELSYYVDSQTYTVDICEKNGYVYSIHISHGTCNKDWKNS